MATEELGQTFSKRNSFSIDSILKNNSKELIKIPKLTCILDGKKLSLTESNSISNANEIQSAKAFDLSVNIPNAIDETSRKSFKNHAQINNKNGLYTNNVLSDLKHLAKAKNKQYVSRDVEQIEPSQNMLKTEMDIDDERKLRYFCEGNEHRVGSSHFDIDEIHEYDSTSDSDTANLTSGKNIDIEAVDLSVDEVTGVVNDEVGETMTIENDSTASDRNFEKPVKFENELTTEEKNSGSFVLLLLFSFIFCFIFLIIILTEVIFCAFR